MTDYFKEQFLADLSHFYFGSIGAGFCPFVPSFILTGSLLCSSNDETKSSETSSWVASEINSKQLLKSKSEKGSGALSQWLIVNDYRASSNPRINGVCSTRPFSRKPFLLDYKNGAKVSEMTKQGLHNDFGVSEMTKQARITISESPK